MASGTTGILRTIINHKVPSPMYARGVLCGGIWGARAHNLASAPPQLAQEGFAPPMASACRTTHFRPINGGRWLPRQAARRGLTAPHIQRSRPSNTGALSGSTKLLGPAIPSEPT